MLEFLLGYCLGRSENSEPEHPRYFREPKPRELTKEEKRKTTIFLIIFGGAMKPKQTDFQPIKKNSRTSKTFCVKPLKSLALTKIAPTLPRCL